MDNLTESEDGDQAGSSKRKVVAPLKIKINKKKKRKRDSDVSEPYSLS